MLHNYELVSLSVTVSEYDLLPGALGTVVDVRTDPRESYEVEFGGQDGGLTPHVVLGPEQVCKLG